MTILLFILSVLFIFASTWLFEGKQDYYMIKDSKGNQAKWKLFGNLYAGSFIAVVSVLVSLLNDQPIMALLLFPILMIVWSIAHDCSVGYYLTGKIFHLGSTGWDAKIKKIFQSGRGWFLAKGVWLTIAIGSFFSLSRNKK